MRGLPQFLLYPIPFHCVHMHFSTGIYGAAEKGWSFSPAPSTKHTAIKSLAVAPPRIKRAMITEVSSGKKFKKSVYEFYHIYFYIINKSDRD